MNIGLDLRCTGNKNHYSYFVCELVTALTKEQKRIYFTIYVNYEVDIGGTNITIKKVNSKQGSWKEQNYFLKILRKDLNDLVIFFDYHTPINYNGDYYIFIPSLKEIYYQNFTNYFKKYSFFYLLERSIKKAKKLICFDNNTKDELIEKYNIEDHKIRIIPPFFPHIDALCNSSDITLNIKAKHNLENDYFIYSFGEGIEKNLERVVKAFKKLLSEGQHYDLLLIGDEISKNISLRNLVINLKIQKYIHFIGNIQDAEKRNYYTQSVACIFPSLYEPFSFCLNEPLVFNTPIVASNLESIKKVLQNNAMYFSGISGNSIYETLNTFLKTRKKQNHSNILEQFGKEQTIKSLMDIIKGV